MGVEGQRVGRDAQGVEQVGGSDALQGLQTLGAHRPHVLLRQTAVPQRQNVSQRHVLLRTREKTDGLRRIGTSRNEKEWKMEEKLRFSW